MHPGFLAGRRVVDEARLQCGMPGSPGRRLLLIEVVPRWYSGHTRQRIRCVKDAALVAFKRGRI